MKFSKLTLGLAALFLGVTLNSEAAVPFRKKKSKMNNSDKARVVQSQIGLKIPEWGIAIDALFNPELTNVIPGYHIVNMVLTNHRQETIYLDPRHDKWQIVDNLGKTHTAYNHVKDFDRSLWPRLPQKLKHLLDYPRSLSPGKSVTVDVFFSRKVDLFNFREVVWKSEHFSKEFNVMTNYEKNLKVPQNSKEFDTPSAATKHVNIEEELKPRSLPDTINYPSKYLSPRPKIGEVQEMPKSKQPLFDPSLDDTIIIRD